MGGYSRLRLFVRAKGVVLERVILATWILQTGLLPLERPPELSSTETPANDGTNAQVPALNSATYGSQRDIDPRDPPLGASQGHCLRIRPLSRKASSSKINLGSIVLLASPKLSTTGSIGGKHRV